jgi:hypothetical protein
MSRLEDYEAGALTSWTPASQAALNAARHDKQQDADQYADPAFEAYRDEEAKARKPVKAALDRATRYKDARGIEKYTAELLKLDEIWGPEIRRWDDQATAEGRLKGQDKQKKEVREEKYEEAEVISAGQVVDNLVSPILLPMTESLMSPDFIMEPTYHRLHRRPYLLLVCHLPQRTLRR